MEIPSDKIELIDDGGEKVASEVEEPEEKSKEKVDDTIKKEEETSKKKEEEASARMSQLEKSNKRLMEIFTSPDFFAKLGKSMKPESVKPELTAEAVKAEKDRLEDMNRADFLAHTLSQVGKATTEAIKPEIEKISTKMSAFISSQAEGTAGTAIQDFIGRVGQSEFDKYGAAMEAKAYTVKGLSMDEIYTLVSGKQAPKYAPSVIPNKTMKPDSGLKDLTEQKDLPLDEAGSRNFDHIFGKYKK